jgi:integrase
MRAPQIGFAQLVQDFFLRRLIAQRGASARTVEAYRDAFELLLGFAEQRTGKLPSALSLADLDAPLVLDFLDYLETGRGNSARTRNARLAAIHSFMRYAALRDPASLPVTGRVLAIPAKRFDRPVLGYLTREQVAAIRFASESSCSWSEPGTSPRLTAAIVALTRGAPQSRPAATRSASRARSSAVSTGSPSPLPPQPARASTSTAALDAVREALRQRIR